MAKNGDVNAQVNVGLCYENGLGTSIENDKALLWYKKAAEKNNPDALLHYGLMLLNGKGIAQNWKDGLNYLVQAKNHGQKDADSLITELCSKDGYSWGGYDVAPFEYIYGVTIDEIVEKKGYLESIAYKSASASYYLAQVYEYNKNYNTALKYYNQAHALFYPDGKTYNENAEDTIDPVSGGEYNFAMEAYVQDNLGFYYENGLGCNIDLLKAIEFYSHSEMRDSYFPSPGACVAILRQAICYKKLGKIDKFIDILSEYVESIPQAWLWLGDTYYNGDGMAVNYNKAFMCFENLLEEEFWNEPLNDTYPAVYADCCYRLYQLYCDGKGVEKDKEMARLYFDEAVKYGCSDAVYEYAKQQGWIK
jgi:hypothetical protein